MPVTTPGQAGTSSSSAYAMNSGTLLIAGLTTLVLALYLFEAPVPGGR